MAYGSASIDDITSSGNLSITGNVAIAGGTTVSGSFSASNMSGQNVIINGAMAVDQRNQGNSQTITAGAALAYTVDRWYAYCTGANVTGQRVAGSGSNLYAYRFTGATSVTAIGFGQRIEALNSAYMAGTTATLSVELANSLLTSVTWTAYYANTTDTFGTLASPTRTQIATGTFTVNSTLTRYSTQISIPSAATTGIEIVFSVGAQISGTWTIDNVQLEPGTVATPFERCNYTDELTKCYRYFVSLNGSNSYQTIMTGTLYNTTNGTWVLYLPTQMRSIPSLTRTGAMYFLCATTPVVTSFEGPYSQIGSVLEGDFVLATSTTNGTSGLIRWNNVPTASRSFNLSSEL